MMTMMMTMTLPQLIALEEPQKTLFYDIDFDLPPIHLDDLQIEAKSDAQTLELPNLYDFNYGLFPALEQVPDASIDNSVASSVEHDEVELNHLDRKEDHDEDIWHFANSLGPRADDVKYLTWEAFTDPTHEEKSSLFISEAGPSAFDVALELQAGGSINETKAGRVVQTNALFKSLWLLGCGRASLLFPLDKERNAFNQAIDDGRASGMTLISSQSLIKDTLNLADATIELRDFVDTTYASCASIPGLVSLAKAASIILDAIECHLVLKENVIKSLLELQALLDRPRQLVLALQDVVSTAKFAKTNEEILAVLFLKAETHETSPIYGLLRSLVARVSEPWLFALEEDIGFRQNWNAIPSKHAIQLILPEEESIVTDGSPIRSGQKNIFFAAADQELAIASNTCLKFLREHQPDHPLCNGGGLREAPKLSLAFNWSDVERIESKAKQYHESLQSALEKNGGDSSLKPTTKKPDVFTDDCNGGTSDWLAFDYFDNVHTPAIAFDILPPVSSLYHSDELYNTITNLLHANPNCTTMRYYSDYPLSLMTHLSLRPFLEVQHRHLTTASLRCIVLEHSVRHHLGLCHAFYLCSSGFFTSRLCSVLFDPNFESVERERNTLRSGSESMGLKLGSGQRREWPPASSELRLALRGVLNESWLVSPFHTQGMNRKHSQEKSSLHSFETNSCRNAALPGGLSFALRNDLKPEEIDRVLDPDSIYALDFLALSYNPPSALKAVFTPSSLEMYSRIFRLMLRLLRMVFVIGQIYRDIAVVGRGRQDFRKNRDEQHTLLDRFRHETNHFITSVIARFVNAGIGQPWTKFSKYLEDLERFVCADSHFTTTTSTNEFSLANLTAMHEATLKAITTSLFLRHRQRNTAIALEKICDTILQLATIVRGKAGGEGSAALKDVAGLERLRALYRQFQEQRAEFVVAAGLPGNEVEFDNLCS